MFDSRHILGLVAVVVLLSSCAGQAEPHVQTTALPLQDAGLVLEEGVEQQATKVAEYPISEQELEEIAQECADAQGIPLGGDDPCPQVMEYRYDPNARGCGRSMPCVEVYAVEADGFAASGYLQITDPRPRHSRCGAAADAVCLRVGVKERVLERLASPSASAEPSAEPPTEPSVEPATEPSPSPESTGTTPAPTSPVLAEATG